MSINIQKNIKKLRELFETECIDAYIVPHEDEFLTEYVPNHSERLSFITGFTGSAGLAIITKNKAAIFVDGRYTTQVKLETSGKIFDYHDLNNTEIENWIKKNIEQQSQIGFCSMTISLDKLASFKNFVSNTKITLKKTDNLIDKIWLERPSQSTGLIYEHKSKFSGVSHKEKKQLIIKEIIKNNCDSLFISEPENTCWFLNIRGDDLEFTPLVRSYSLVQKNGEINLFSNHELSNNIKKYFKENDIIHLPINKIEEFFKNKNFKKTIFDFKTTPFELADTIFKYSNNYKNISNPCSLLKACKNKTEIEGAIKAHIRDGVALTKFLFWLNNKSEQNKLNEIDVEEKLLELRKNEERFISPSFNTIAGTGSNGAIVHYKANHTSCKNLKAGDLLLVDSGGQYLDGTTDVTRTVALFPNEKTIQKEKKDRFTRVLKGHIAIACSVFKKGTSGKDLDPYARKYLIEEGLDYKHGTGHGVGSFLGVHEGPQSISPLGVQEIKEGMIISNEPGYYKENEYGIRIENLILTKEMNDSNNLYFKTLTLAPIDKNLISREMLNDDEIDWIDKYHEKVYKNLSGFMQEKELVWLKKSCEPILQ
jgi:Xaa-Pro aminopeptidase